MIIELICPRASAEIFPSEGGRVQRLVDSATGRQILYQGAPPGRSRPEWAIDSPGGWDDLFPNDAPWRGYPDHGRLWSTTFEVVARGAEHAVFRASLLSPLVDVERTYTFLRAPRRGLRVETAMIARDDIGPFLWASHPMLAVGEGWRIALPPECALEADAELPGRFAAGTNVGLAQHGEALSVPAANLGWSEVLYAAGCSSASVASPDGHQVTRVSWDADFLRHLWLVTITGELGFDLCFLFEPCTSRPFRLDEAIERGDAPSLVAGQRKTWWTEVESLDPVDAPGRSAADQLGAVSEPLFSMRRRS